MWTPIALPDPIPAPAGAYTPLVRAGNLLFVSGQVPRNPENGELIGQTVAEQTRQVMRNLERALEAGGASLRDLVAVTVFLTDPGAWSEFDATYREIMTPPYPTRTAVGVQLRGILVEINAIAFVG